MAGLFQSISNALSGSNSSTNSGGSSNSSGAASSATVFDNAGNEITPSSQQGNTNTPSPPSLGGNGDVSPASSGVQNIEDLLFGEPPAPKATAVPNEPDNKQTPENKDTKELVPGLTAQQLIQNLSSVNFMGAIPEDTVTAALGGDTKAFSSIITTVAQLSAAIAVKQSVDASRSLLDSRFTEFDSNLNNKIGESKYQDVLADPRFSNPFVKPLATELMTKLRQRDPSITPDQIKQTLPKLIEYSMKNFTTVSTTQQNQNVRPGQSVPTEVKFDELF